MIKTGKHTHTLQISATLYLYTEPFPSFSWQKNDELLLHEVVITQKSHISSNVYHFSQIDIPLYTVASNPTVCQAEAKKKKKLVMGLGAHDIHSFLN